METFDEIVRYFAKTDRTIMKPKVADKLGLKKYARAKGVAVPKTLCEGPTVDHVLNKNLPDTCVIKANNDSGGVMIIKDGQVIKGDKSKVMRHNKIPYGVEKGEWWYGNIKPRYFAEEYLDDNIRDYKVHCINGNPVFTQIIGDRLTHPMERIVLADGTITEYLLHYKRYHTDSYNIPQSYSSMVDIARKLSSPFKYCRVDLFTVGDTIYAGEITFLPDALMGSRGPNQKEIGRLLLQEMEK